MHIDRTKRGKDMLEKCGYARGGLARHPDAAQDKKLIGDMIHKAEREKGEKPTEFARGGAPRSKAGKHVTNVIIAPQGPRVAPPAGGAPVVPRPPAAPGPMAAPPMRGGAPMGAPPMRRGGRARGC